VSRSKQYQLPFGISWFYKKHHTRKHPELFVKIGGALFIDLDALDALIEQSRGIQHANTHKLSGKKGSC
jgi:hypothetical protein